MRRAPLLKLGVILALAFFAAISLAQTASTIRVDVKLVHILATVKDASGALVGSLTKDDFTVRDNGVTQQIAVFERQTDQPLSIAVLIDNSGSTAKDLSYETDSVNRFMRAVTREGNPADAVALYSFNWEVVRQASYTRNPASIDRAVRGLHGEAGTALYDAVLLASRDIQNRSGRRVLIVITDGGDTVSHSDFNAAVEAAGVADAIIYPVLVVPISNDAGRNTGGENALTTMSVRTGGRVFQPTVGAALDRAFDEILRDLRTQYFVGYYPAGIPATKDRFHLLDVKTRRADFTVSARSGYYEESSSAAPSGSNTVSPAAGEDETLRPRKPVPPKGKGQ